jgi:hypothetical protein
MSVGTEGTPVAPPPPVEPKPNPFQRIVGALLSPSETFQSIARRPDVLVALIILLIVSFLFGLVVAAHVDFGAAARESMEQKGNASPAQIEQGVRIASTIGKIATYCSPLLTLIFLLIIAGVLLIAHRMFGGEGDFKQAFSVLTYASYVTVIEGLIRTIILMAKGGMVSGLDMATLVRSNPAFLVDQKDHPVLFSLFSSIDIFTIWYVVLLVIGFAAISKLSRKKSATIIIGLWILVILIKVGFAALQAGMKS